MYVDDPEDKSTWTTFWVKIWRRGVFPDSPASQGLEALAYLKETTKNLVEPFQSQLDWTPSDGSATCFIDEMKTWTPIAPLESHDGRVALAGDAAHPMLVYRGQGFQHAVVDADNYVNALLKIRDGGESREAAIAAYNDEMVPRGATAVEQSLKEASLSMDLESVKKMMMARQGHGRST
jgi:2-polyprenyl-6-methoxyphenol hydroxylase-like FAD-dependent oxidoreductase